MHPDLHDYGGEISLVMNSGIQFIDFGLKVDWKSPDLRNKQDGYFIYSGSNKQAPMRRLILRPNGDGYCDGANPGMKISEESALDVRVADSLKLFDGIWLPIPFFRSVPPERFDEGPYNWARMRVMALNGEDEDGNTHRITFAFDTKVFNLMQNALYLAPTGEDIKSGVVFSFAYQSHQMNNFLDFQWVTEWLKELYEELAPEPTRLKADWEDIQEGLRDVIYQAHYLNILALVGDELTIPMIRIASNKRDDSEAAIPVDLMLDVGNSRTCGILIEDHVQDNDGMQKRYELEIRDLSLPEKSYKEPFYSRIEFSQATFGKEHFSVLSGRRDAFQWPSIVRVGTEAERLASRREGNEGSTGISSPKRYLWDIERYEQSWRFNSSYVKTDREPFATAEPLSSLINELGEVLHGLRDDVEDEFDRKMPVFHPHYSRSSLMTFMLTEVLLQALMQMNSPTQRAKLEHSKTPRYLRSVILTVPPAMPKPEREVFHQRVLDAIGLVWKGLGWDMTDEDMDFSDSSETNQGRQRYWPVLPEVHIQWDEATCGQIVYLFNETQHNYAGRPEEFIAAMVRPEKDNKRTLTVATIDIGGGTTDLVINDFALDYGDDKQAGSNAYIVPKQRFRDGFKVAGDDILFDMIRDVVLSSLVSDLKAKGLVDPEPVLSELIGTQVLKVQDRLLRQQLTLQVFTPIGLRILKEYENYDVYTNENNLSGQTFGQILGETNYPTENVLNYINEPISRQLGYEFNILNVPLRVDFAHIHKLFILSHYDICKTFEALCEIVNNYQCDVLLLTGRPSRLPGVQAYFKSRLPLPVGRIFPLYHYKTGSWYPFHKQNRIDDPKTTAAVGAMLCFLSKNGRIPNFYFRPTALKPYSTVKYLGLLDHNNTIPKDNVYYSDIDLDNEDRELCEDSYIPLRGTARLGFRQLSVDRWTASPLYLLTVEDAAIRQKLTETGATLKVKLKTEKTNRKHDGESFVIASVESDSFSVRKSALKLQLNTMLEASLNDSLYWLDTGSVKR